MNFFKPWTWFHSEERQLKIELLKLQIQEIASRLTTKGATSSGESAKDPAVKKPYKTLRLIDTTVVLTTNDDEVLSKENVDRHFYESVKACVTEEQVLNLFIPSVMFDEEHVIVETADEKKQVTDNLDILRNHPDFDIKEDGTVMLKGIGLPMPAFVAGSFIEILEKQLLAENAYEKHFLEESYEALKMFWYWTALNPIPSSRNDLLSFVRREDIKITKNGLLQMYRRVVNVGAVDKILVETISNNYYKIKKYKKAPRHYRLMKNDDVYFLEKEVVPMTKGEMIGNLEKLYLNLPEMSENRYTDGHTRTKDIRVGQVYSEDESKIDLDNKQSCSNGLHVGSHTFMFDSFGDTGVLALVNPSKVRSVPVHEGNKMRVSEMFIAAVLPIESYKEDLKDMDVQDYSQEYFNNSVEQLAEIVKTHNYDELNCQNNNVAVNSSTIQDIVGILSSKVVEVED